MKFLNDNQFLALNAKADGFDAIVARMCADNAELVPADITAEDVIAALGAAGSVDATAIQASVDLLTQLTALTSRVAELEGIPAEEPTTVGAESDSVGEVGDIIAFANKHKGDDVAIVAEMKKQNLL